MTRVPLFKNVFLGLILGATCFGCSGSDRPQLAKVTGTVNYKGKPIIEGDIAFYPENGRAASGQISGGEIIDVETFENGDGAPVGKLKVTVSAFDGPKDNMYKPPKLITPSKYSSLQTTDLTAEIAPGENVLNLELKD